ncbi:hypothetical protein ACOMHN_065621 [Nucella lapillus]
MSDHLNRFTAHPDDQCPAVVDSTPDPCRKHSMKTRNSITRRCVHCTCRTATARLRPLMGRLRPLLHWWGWSPHRWPRSIRVFPFIHSIRTSRRRTASVVAIAIVMTAVLLCHRVFSQRAKIPCTLWCPLLSAVPTPHDQALWHPRVVPIDHACVSKTALPVPCLTNASYSALLEQPPISFLNNFHNPCWYEPLNITATSHPADAWNDSNPYASNLYTCFSHAARRHFTFMAREIFRQNRHRQKADDTTWLWQDPRRLRCLPYFYIAGMPKSGSTDLFRKLMLHPDIVKPPMKEPHWWSKNRFGQRLNFSSSIPFEDYVDLFDRPAREIERRSQRVDDVSTTDDDILLESGHNDVSTTTGDDNRNFYHPAITMDASASTFWNNDEWWRLQENCNQTQPLFTNAHYIRHLTPQAKVIVILRNPTDRLFSDYLYFTKTKKSLTAFHDDVLLSIEKLNNCTDQSSLRACIYDKRTLAGKGKVRLRIGVYHVYLSEWLSVFPRSQLLVLRTEDYSRNSRRTLRRIHRFLGLPPMIRQQEKRVLQLPKANTRRLEDQKLGSMLPETRQALQEFYRPHNHQLAELLQDTQFLWQEEEEEASMNEPEFNIPKKPGEIARRSTGYDEDHPTSKETLGRESQEKNTIGKFKTSLRRDEYVDLYVDKSENSLYNRTRSFALTHGDRDARTVSYYRGKNVDEVEYTTQGGDDQTEAMTNNEDVDVDDTDAVWKERSENFENEDDEEDDYDEDTDYKYSEA